MSNLRNDNKSVYEELKEFYDNNSGGIYSYQSFQKAGAREFKLLFDLIQPLKEYERNRMAAALVEYLCNYVNGIDKSKDIILGYITLNPIINYYEEILKHINALKEYDKETFGKLEEYTLDAVLKSKESEEVKLGILMFSCFSIKNAKNILMVFSIHNDYLFYVLESYKKYKNFNNFVFKLAKNSKAYGKAFCVRELEPATNEIKKWLIEEGSECETASHELLAYSMLSFDIAQYLSENEFDEKSIENLSRTFSIFLSDYSLDEIQNYNEVCKNLIYLIDKSGKGIYSLYAIVAIIYVIESIIIEEYNRGPHETDDKNGKNFRFILDSCREVCKKGFWKEVIADEINCIETEISVLISCIEKTGYKITINEFATMLNREPFNALMYKYAFSFGNLEIRKYAFEYFFNNFNKTELLSGQDQLHVNDAKYEELQHVCYFIIIKYSRQEEFKEQYKSINIEALRSPFIETRIQAVNNLSKFKDNFTSSEKEEIQDCIGSEVLIDIKNRLAYLIDDSNEKVEVKRIDVKDSVIEPHVKDIYIVTTNIKDTYKFDASPIYNKLIKEEMIYLILDKDNPYSENAIQTVTTDGYVIGYIPEEYSVILSNLLKNGKFLYAAVEDFSKDYKNITISVYLSYRDVIDEITTTLSLLSKEKEKYLQ